MKTSSGIAIAALTLGGLTACAKDDSGRRTPQVATGVDESFLDEKADPCKDFYQFSCGQWIKQHPVEPGYTEARFDSGDLRNDIFFQLVLEGDVDASGLDSARAYFDACMGLRSGADDFGPAQTLLDEVNGLSSKDAIPALLADLHRAGVYAFFDASPSADPGDPTRRILWLSDSGWSLPSRDSYGDTDLIGEYEDHASRLASLFSTTSFDAAAAGALEARIATATPPLASQRDPSTTYNPTSAEDLATKVPAFDWGSYFDKSGFGAPDTLNIVDPDYFTELATIFADSSLDALKSYLLLRVFEATESSASVKTLNEQFRFHGGVLYGRTKPQPDDFACLLDARSLFGTSLAKAFVERYLPSGSVTAVTKLSDGIRRALHDDIEGVSWLDDDTRSRALQKLDAMLAKIGYQEPWDLRGEPSVAEGTSYAKAVADAWHRYHDLTSQRLSDPVDRSEWTLSPDVTNAEYSPAENAITVPVAIFESPFFSVNWASAASYGAIGAVIGHEMTHGFDDEGRHYDATGALTNWWTDGVDTEFRNRAACLVDQFGAYEPLPDVHIDGQLTLGENIADLGGLKLAYAAFEKAATRTSPSSRFSPEQAFFVSYAQLWCSNDSDGVVKQELATDPHSPPKFRVNGVVQNIPQFAKAFQCKGGAPLAPRDRCAVW
jgi:endothelin-converting enzyme/putative endopeptidase